MHADQHRRSMCGLLLGLQRHSILNKCGSLASLTLVRILLQQYGVPSRDQQIFLSRNGAPANIVYHRKMLSADTAAFRQIGSGRGPLYYEMLVSKAIMNKNTLTTYTKSL